MKPPVNRPRYRIVLEALPDEFEGPAAPRRLARVLKYALRACRLKCVEVVQLPEPVLIPDPTKGKKSNESHSHIH